MKASRYGSFGAVILLISTQLLSTVVRGQQEKDEFASVNFDVSSSAPGYRVHRTIKETKLGLEIPLKLSNRRKGINLYGKTIDDIVVQVDYETDDRLHVKIYDKEQKQFPVPDSPLGLERPAIDAPAHNPSYEFKYTDKPFGFQVIRTSDKAVLFDTTGFPLVFEDQYLELTTTVPDDANIYGLGETTAPFRRNNIRNVTTIFAAGETTPWLRNVYGSHPYYTEVRDGKAHSVLLLSAHGMDVLTVEGRITYKVIGGILDFYFFIPKDTLPNSVSKAYTDFIGKPFMPALWMLGWHQCRWGYPDLDYVEYAIDMYKQHEIPLEVQWLDIDYMDRYKDFSFDPVKFPKERVQALSEQLHASKQHLVTMVDPGISTNSSYAPYERGVEMDVFIRNPDGTEYQGEVWPGFTAFPDWWHPNTSDYWTNEIVEWMNTLQLDGIWVDMNEPDVFCTGSCGSGLRDTIPPNRSDPAVQAENVRKLDAMGIHVTDDTRNLLHPKYAINNVLGDLSIGTVATIAKHFGGIYHYDLHNIYGHAETSITHNAILKYKPKERPFLLTRSSFPGTGKYAGHWTGDNWSYWSYLKNSISEILNINMFGMPYSGADVCGFMENATETLCTRWQEIGAFYPFARNHNRQGTIDQEPFQWESTAEATRKTLAIRYSLLPYYYTLFEEAHRTGATVWRALIFEYPDHSIFVDNAEQVLVGSDILLSPVVEENATSVDAVFPTGIWYDWYTYEPTIGSSEENYVTLDAPLTHIPVHIRGGSIIPLKTPAMTVAETYSSPYSLLIALDKSGEASGRLYVDDGHSLHQPATSSISFTYSSEGELRAAGTFGYDNAELLETIKIIGAKDLSTAHHGGDEYSLVEEEGAFVLRDAGIRLSEFIVTFE